MAQAMNPPIELPMDMHNPSWYSKQRIGIKIGLVWVGVMIAYTISRGISIMLGWNVRWI